MISEIDNFKKLLNIWKIHLNDGLNCITEKFISDTIDIFIPYFSFIYYTSAFNELSRLTINKKVIGKNERINEIKYLKYPPEDRVSQNGRCNFKKQSIFYGSLDIMTSISEMLPEVDDLITESKWKLKDNYELCFVPIFGNQPSDSSNPRTRKFKDDFEKELLKLPEEIRFFTKELTYFISNSFSKKVKTHHDYFFSAYYSDRLLYKSEEGKIDAMLYPSVNQDLAFENLAIKPKIFDEHYELIEVVESLVIKTPRDGDKGFGMEIIGCATDFDYKNGLIFWDK
jgi:hypothetical protein